MRTPGCWSGVEAVEVVNVDRLGAGEDVLVAVALDASRMGSARCRIESGAVVWEAWSCARSAAAGSDAVVMLIMRNQRS